MAKFLQKVHLSQSGLEIGIPSTRSEHQKRLQSNTITTKWRARHFFSTRR